MSNTEDTSFFARLFTDHPDSVGETYFEHMIMALKFSGNCAFASFCLFFHAFFPFSFKETGSSTIKHLFDIMVKKRLEQKEKIRLEQEKIQNELDTDSENSV
jgi:hypothetical protein